MKNNFLKLITIILFMFLSTMSSATQKSINSDKNREREKELLIKERNIENKQLKKNQISDIENIKGHKIKKLIVSGNTILSRKEIKHVLNKYIGKKGGANIINCMKELENLYLEKGYITTRVKIDMRKTQLKKQTIAFIVIEGDIEQINFKSKKFDTKRRRFFLLPYEKGDKLNIAELDQGIDNLNYVSKNSSSFDVLPGKTLGGSIVEISNKLSKRVSGSLNYNNLGQISTGEERVKLSLKVEDIIGVSDSLTGNYQQRLQRNKDGNNNESYSIGYRIPYRYWNFCVNSDNSNYLISSHAQEKIYKYSGKTKNISYTIDRVIYRKADIKTDLDLTLTNKNTVNNFENTKLDGSSRKLSILNIGLNDQRSLLKGVLYTSLSYYRGVHIFGAESDKGKNRYLPKAQFIKFTTNINWYRPIQIKKQRFAYRFGLSGQYTNDVLYSSEKLSIGDDTTVRGFKNDSLQGDRGFYIRNEFSYMYKFFEPFIGYDAGWVKNVHDNLSFNKYGNELTGISAGLRVYWKYLTGSIIYSKGFTSPSNIDQNNHIVYVNISLLF